MKATQGVEGSASTQQPSQKQLMRAGQGQQQQQPTPGTKAASGEHEHPGQATMVRHLSQAWPLAQQSAWEDAGWVIFYSGSSRGRAFYCSRNCVHPLNLPV